MEEKIDYPLDLALDDLIVENGLKPVELRVEDTWFGKEYKQEFYRKDDNLYIVKKDYSLRIKPNWFKIKQYEVDKKYTKSLNY